MLYESLSFTVKESENSDYLAFLSINPSPLCRSNEPILNAGYVVLNPDALHKGYGKVLMNFQGHVGMLLGFEGETFVIIHRL